MKRVALTIVVTVALVLAACGGDDGGSAGGGEASRGECTPAPISVNVQGLPDAFPIVKGVVFTDSNEAGPSTIVEGYLPKDLEEAFPAYKTAFENAHGWVITKDEQETDDAEIFFQHGKVNGQVNMFAECDARTRLRITVRPS